VDIYDVASNSWTTAELSVPRFYITAVTSGNKVFFAGGKSGIIGDVTERYHSTVDIYDISTNTWSVTNLKEASWGMTAVAFGNKVYFTGGDNFGTVTNKVEVYDIPTNTWSILQLSEAKNYMSVIAFQNKLYFAGGWVNGPVTGSGPFGDPQNFSSKIEIYDIASGSWSYSSLSEAKARISGVSTGGKIFWAGGVTVKGPTCKVEILDGTTQTMSLDYLSDTEGWGPIVRDNKIIYGRWNGKFDVYDLTTATWSIAILPANTVVGNLLLVNNRLYMAGGDKESNGMYVPSGAIYKLEF
jgi:hypothetical protein